MQSERLSRLAIEALEDLKAVDIVRLEVRKLSDFTDYMIIASGRSARQVAALAEHLVMKAKEAGEAPLGVEGLRDGEWVLVDLCDVVVHIMQPEVREFYQLEKLWGGRESAERESPRGAAS
jgi:ribosome-associated protein